MMIIGNAERDDFSVLNPDISCSLDAQQFFSFRTKKKNLVVIDVFHRFSMVTNEKGFFSLPFSLLSRNENFLGIS